MNLANKQIAKKCISPTIEYSVSIKTVCQSAVANGKKGGINFEENKNKTEKMAACASKKPFVLGDFSQFDCGCDTRNRPDKMDLLNRKTYHLPPKITEGAIMKRIISTPLAPRPVAPYSQAVVADRTVYVSGCVGINKETNKLVPGGIVEETRQAMNSLGIILHEAGSCFGNIVKTTVLLSDIKDFPVFNEVYREYFEDERSFPARCAYQVAALPLGAKVEIDAIALTGDVAKDDK